MEDTRRCEHCIWFDQCREDETCDCYEPASIKEQESTDIAEYLSDVSMRHEYYQEQIVEQNG